MACGQYWDAAKQLRSTAEYAKRSGVELLERTVAVHQLWLETALGRKRAAERARRRFLATRRSELDFLEAWIELLVAAVGTLEGRREEKRLEDARQAFSEMGVSPGERMALAALLRQAVAVGPTRKIRALLRALDRTPPTSHRFLSVLEPLVRAEAHFTLGEIDPAESAVEEAAAAIVGLPFLELDWRIEFVRARLAERKDDRTSARGYLHRCLHTRDLLARALPATVRKRFLSHPRFSELQELSARLERRRPTPLTQRLPRSEAGFCGLIGESAALERVFETIETLCDQEIPVLITGETGTGKELVARAICENSPRRHGRFLALHCASLPDELFESELFGYEAGAFTGADASQPGLLEHLEGGTLLLDEVSSLSPAAQGKLLRTLESRVVRPVGGVDPRAVDVRWLSTSSVDLGDAVDRGDFRRDLYYRLRGIELRLPPLRERRADIPLLVRHLLHRHASRLDRGEPSISREGLDLLTSRSWPGNVRELEGLIVQALLLSPPHAVLDAETLRPLLARRGSPSLFSEEQIAGRELDDLRRELEKTYLVRLFRETRGNVSAMAQQVGLKRGSLYA
ncbi:MAG: sigma 54-interacting transcriptional regulator [Planctomycetota bacterium]|nr:sigma 54-interacting transcriptional regulator [Planctomycetota bacterium]